MNLERGVHTLGHSAWAVRLKVQSTSGWESCPWDPGTGPESPAWRASQTGDLEQEERVLRKIYLSCTGHAVADLYDVPVGGQEGSVGRAVWIRG